MRYIPNKTSPKIGLNRCALRCALLVKVVDVVEVVDDVDVIEVVQVVEVVLILWVVKIVFAFVFGIPSIFPTSRLSKRGQSVGEDLDIQGYQDCPPQSFYFVCAQS